MGTLGGHRGCPCFGMHVCKDCVIDHPLWSTKNRGEDLGVLVTNVKIEKKEPSGSKQKAPLLIEVCMNEWTKNSRSGVSID